MVKRLILMVPFLAVGVEGFDNILGLAQQFMGGKDDDKAEGDKNMFAQVIDVLKNPEEKAKAWFFDALFANEATSFMTSLKKLRTRQERLQWWADWLNLPVAPRFYHDEKLQHSVFVYATRWDERSMEDDAIQIDIVTPTLKTHTDVEIGKEENDKWRQNQAIPKWSWGFAPKMSIKCRNHVDFDTDNFLRGSAGQTNGKAATKGKEIEKGSRGSGKPRRVYLPSFEGVDANGEPVWVDRDVGELQLKTMIHDISFALSGSNAFPIRQHLSWTDNLVNRKAKLWTLVENQKSKKFWAEEVMRKYVLRSQAFGKEKAIISHQEWGAVPRLQQMLMDKDSKILPTISKLVQDFDFDSGEIIAASLEALQRVSVPLSEREKNLRISQREIDDALSASLGDNYVKRFLPMSKVKGFVADIPVVGPLIAPQIGGQEKKQSPNSDPKQDNGIGNLLGGGDVLGGLMNMFR